MKPVKVKAVKLYTEVPNCGFLRNEKKNSKKESLESKLQLSLLTIGGPLNHRIVNFPFNCCAFSLLELMICIEMAFYRNERYLFVT